MFNFVPLIGYKANIISTIVDVVLTEKPSLSAIKLI